MSDKSIIRTQKNRENPYVMIDKTFLSDDRLSWKAKGLLAYFLSKPDDWRILIVDLIKQSTDGEKAVRSGLKELETCGYLENRAIKDEKGRIQYWEKTVYERPINPDAQNGKVDESPDACFLHVENVHVEKDVLLINDITKNEKTNKRIDDDDKLNKSSDSFFQREFIAEATDRRVPHDEITDTLKELQNTPYQLKALDITFDKVMPKYEKGEVSKFSSYFVSVLKREQRRLEYVHSQPERQPQEKTEYPFYNWLEN